MFPPKMKHRSLDESCFKEEAGNYKSAEQYCKELEEKFQKDEEKGWMYPTTQGVLADKYPGQLFTMVTTKGPKVVERVPKDPKAPKVAQKVIIKDLVGLQKLGLKGNANLFACDFRTIIAISVPTANLPTFVQCPNPTEKLVGAIIVLVITIRLLTDQRSLTTVSHHQFNFLPIRMDFQLAFHHRMVHLSMERTLFQRTLTQCM